MAKSLTVKAKRIYDPHESDDGFRVLVDRLWPRGMKKTDAQVDLWAKDVAPTPDLRKWFDHDPSKFDEFRTRYLKELAENLPAVSQIIVAADGPNITLLYAARDAVHNHANVLLEFINQHDGV